MTEPLRVVASAPGFSTIYGLDDEVLGEILDDELAELVDLLPELVAAMEALAERDFFLDPGGNVLPRLKAIAAKLAAISERSVAKAD